MLLEKDSKQFSEFAKNMKQIKYHVRSNLRCIINTHCQWHSTGQWFSAVLRFPPPIKLTATIWLKYCWKWR